MAEDNNTQYRTLEQIKRLIREEVRQKKEVEKTYLLNKFNLHSDYLEDILVLLSNVGDVAIARVQSFGQNDRVVNHSVTIRWIGRR